MYETKYTTYKISYMHETVTTQHNLNEDSETSISTDLDNSDQEEDVADNREEDDNEGDHVFPVTDLSKILEVQGIGLLQFIILHNTYIHTYHNTHTPDMHAGKHAALTPERRKWRSWLREQCRNELTEDVLAAKQKANVSKLARFVI